MNTFADKFKDACHYSVSDWKILVSIGTIMILISILQKITIQNKLIDTTFFIAATFLLFIEMGYGSKIAATSIRGDEFLPKLNKIKKLLREGFKKTTILGIYSIPLTFLYKHAAQYFLTKPHLALICCILFIFIYIILILGLINRYNYKGQFLKAFDFKEIFEILKNIEIKKLITVAICAGIGHIFVIVCFIDLYPSFNMVELCNSILAFFLAPWTLITTKRLIALNVRELLNSIKN